MKIYKYVCVSEYSISNLLNDSIYLNNIMNMNDIFETNTFYDEVKIREKLLLEAEKIKTNMCSVDSFRNLLEDMKKIM